MQNVLSFVFVFVIGNCNFEIDKCSWFDVYIDDFDWLFGSGTIISLFIGFRTDYIIGNVIGKVYFIFERKYKYIIFSFFMFLSLNG